MNFLKDAVRVKKTEVALAKRETPLKKLKLLAARTEKRRIKRSFAHALRKKPIALIAEIKLKSPSIDRIGHNLLELAQAYAKSPADAVSVLTDKRYFSGSPNHLSTVRKIVSQPLLRKDFIIDEYQIYESIVLGADAILLIAALLPPTKLRKFINLAREVGLDCLVEVHSASEVKKALRAGAKIVGINNRDLKSLKINLNKTADLVKLLPEDKIVVSESGLLNAGGVKKMQKLGIQAVLAGSAIVQSKNPLQKIKELKLQL